MNVIFLDIDGVLNTERFQLYQIKNHEADAYYCCFNFDPICMKNLKYLVETYKCKIVISSTWRYGGKENNKYWDAIINNLREYKIEQEVIDMTPVLHSKRGYEIQKWIDNNTVDKFVIIDDDDDMVHLKQYLAKCDCKTGLNKEVKEKCIKILESDK